MTNVVVLTILVFLLGLVIGFGIGVHVADRDWERALKVGRL
jgi:hypothetical protein